MAGFINCDDIELYYQISDMFLNVSLTETQGLDFTEELYNKLKDNCRQFQMRQNTVWFVYVINILPIIRKAIILLNVV